MVEILFDEKTVESAREYVTLAEKREFVEWVTLRCWSKYQSSYGDEQEEMPPLYAEDGFRRRRYLMGAFLRLWFGADIERESDDDPWLMSEAEFDRIASMHPINRLQTLKSNAKLRDKVFNIIDDYRDLEKLLRGEMQARALTMNDPVMRQSEMANRMTEQLKASVASYQAARKSLGQDGEGDGG